MEKIGSVYILETEDKTLLKISYSTRLLMRLRELAKHILGEFHAGVRLIGFFPAFEQAEQAREDFHHLMSMARTALPASMVEAVAVRAFPFWN